MLAVLALREVTVHHGDRVAPGVAEGVPDEATLGLLAVAREAAVQFQGRLAGEQGDAVVAFRRGRIGSRAPDLGLGKLVVGDLEFPAPITSGWCCSISAASWCGGRRPLILKETIFMVGVLAKTGMQAQPGGCLATWRRCASVRRVPMAVRFGALPALWSAADGDGQAIRSTNRRGEACVAAPAADKRMRSMPDQVTDVRLLTSCFSREVRSLYHHAYRHEPTFAYLMDAQRAGIRPAACVRASGR